MEAFFAALDEGERLAHASAVRDAIVAQLPELQREPPSPFAHGTNPLAQFSVNSADAETSRIAADSRIGRTWSDLI